MSAPLKKPQFIKIKEIGPGKHCYHVYATVVEAKTSEKETHNGPVKIIEGVVGDETGCANFRFSADQAAWVQAGKTVAIRNGLSSVVNEHILLEVDKFGRVTEEKDVKIDKVNSENNISKTSYLKKDPSAKKEAK